MAILEVKNIEKHFGSTKVLKDISFDLEEGQTLAIIGSSGSGKTTLLRCLNFLETPNHGTISVKGEKLFDASLPRVKKDKALRDKRLHFGMVFQSFNLFPQYTALENVMLAQKLLAEEREDYKKNKKEIVILSLIFIAIIECIVLLILFKILILMKDETINGTIKDKFYLSQEPTMYVSKQIHKIISDKMVLDSYYSIYKDGTIYYTLSYATPDIYPESLQEFFFIKKLNHSEQKNLKSELISLSNSQFSITNFSSIGYPYSIFKVNGTRHFIKDYDVYSNILAKYINIVDYIKK